MKYRSFLDHVERQYFGKLYEKHNGNKTAISRASGLARMTVYTKLRRLGLIGDQT